jgi:hypothetical protein
MRIFLILCVLIPSMISTNENDGAIKAQHTMFACYLLITLRMKKNEKKKTERSFVKDIQKSLNVSSQVSYNVVYIFAYRLLILYLCLFSNISHQ